MDFLSCLKGALKKVFSLDCIDIKKDFDIVEKLSDIENSLKSEEQLARKALNELDFDYFEDRGEQLQD